MGTTRGLGGKVATDSEAAKFGIANFAAFPTLPHQAAETTMQPAFQISKDARSLSLTEVAEPTTKVTR